MKLFMDTDIIIKLSVHHLLGDVPASFGCRQEDVFVLPTAKYQIHACRYRNQYAAADLLSIKTFLEDQAPIPDPAKRIREQLGNVEKIDEGEVILFGAAYRDKEALILTDDKKSLRALYFSQECSDICDGLKKRCYPLCSVLLRLIAHQGLDKVRSRIALPPEGEQVVIDAFAKKSQVAIENVLKSDLLKLQQKSGELLGEFT